MSWESARPHPSQIQGYKSINLSFDKRTPFQKDFSGSVSLGFNSVRPAIQTRVGHCSPGPAGAWLLLMWAADLSITRWVLVLLAGRIEELWDCGGFQSDFKGRPGRYARSPREGNVLVCGHEAEGVAETPGRER